MSRKYYTGRFGAPWSPSLLWISWGVTAGFLAAILFACLKGGPAGWFLSAALLLTLFITALFTVRGYQLHEQTLRIQRLFLQTEVDLKNIQSALIDPKAFHKSIKTFGNGGLFSFSGYYWSKRLGKFKCYVTDMKRSVIIDIDGKKWVISPDSPESFVRALGINSEKKDERSILDK